MLVLAQSKNSFRSLGAGRLVYDERQLPGRHGGNKHEVIFGVVGKCLVEHSVHDHRRGDGEQQGVSVRRRNLDRLCADDAAGTGLVFDQHRLTNLLRNVLAVGTGEEVSQTACWIADDDLDGLRRPLLRLRGTGKRHCHGQSEAGGEHDTTGAMERHGNFLPGPGGPTLPALRRA